MSSPKEPGYPRTGDRPDSGGEAADGSSARGEDSGTPTGAAQPANPKESDSGRIADPGDVPPWQRGPARGSNPPPHRPPPPAPAGTRSDGQRSGPPVLDTGKPEAYASELPDLSGPVPRPPQRSAPTQTQTPTPAPTPAPGAASPSASASTATIERPTTDRPGAAPPGGGRIQVGTRNQGPVRASMQIRRIDPWSALKVSLVLSVALFFVWMIAVAFLYLVLGGMGVWSKLNSNVGDLLTSASGSTGGELVSSGTIFGGATLIGLVNIVLMSAMATVGVFIYNLTTDLVGGVEVTLADRD